MDKRVRIAGIAAAVAFSVWVLTSPSDPVPIPPPPTGGPDDSVMVVAENLDKPRHITISGDNVFVTEREGRIRLALDGIMLDDPVATLRPAEDFDAGLTGIAAHPAYDANGLLYAYMSYAEQGSLYNRILEIRVADNKLIDARTILDGIPGSRFTNGGIMKFGPDGMLYVGTGTPSDSSHLPQEMESLAGKVLRINPDGSIPEDNPFPGSLVYSLGHRSPRGMAWDGSGSLYVIEAGPEKNDEINRIVPGGNYGWPESECSGGGHLDAAVCYDPAIEPGGMHFSTGTAATPGYLVVSALRSASLFEIDVEEGIPSQKTILGGVGRIRDAAQAPDGTIYVITSNTDGKGFPAETDDLLLRIQR